MKWRMEDGGKFSDWMKKLPYYWRGAYYTVATNSLDNGDTDVDFVVVTESGAHNVELPTRPMVLILAGSFELRGKTYIEGVIRIDPLDVDNASAVCRHTGDDISVDSLRGVDAFDVFRAIDSFVPNPDGDGIAYPFFPGVDYRQVQR